MWSVVGVLELVGIGVLLCASAPIQMLVTYAGRKLRSKVAQLTDTRVQLMSELVAGIQV